MMNSERAGIYLRIYLFCAGPIACISVIAQVALSVSIMMAAGRTFWDALDRVFCFFTTWTNVALVLYYSAHFFRPKSPYAQFWIRPIMEAGLALNLIVVSSVFALVLQGYLHHTGLALWLDRSLHFITPGMYLLYWAGVAPKGLLTWRDITWWLGFPLVYFLYVLARGTGNGAYPYPFLNAQRLGYGTVFLNATIYLTLFWMLGFLLVWIDYGLSRLRKTTVLTELPRANMDSSIQRKS